MTLERINEIRARHRERHDHSLRDIRKVLIILTAPRSGSSLLFSMLKRQRCFYSPTGETTPFYLLHGLQPRDFTSEYIDPDRVSADTLREFEKDFMDDLSTADPGCRPIEGYLNDLYLRFIIQWPEVHLEHDIFTRVAAMCLQDDTRDTEGLYLRLIKRLRELYPAINPYYYDIPENTIQKAFPLLDVPSGPPASSTLIEVPPFITVEPRKKVVTDDLTCKTLLIKTPPDCYRMDFIHRLFPNASIKAVHLTRNPAGTISGLYDGWLHRGFFSRNLRDCGIPLNIAGYSDIAEHGRWWWNYDLPAGWDRHRNSSLGQVCAFQWSAAHQAIDRYLNASGTPCCHVRYENIVASENDRAAELNKIACLLGERFDPASYRRLPMVQITRKPRHFRWEEKKSIIAPLLSTDMVLEGMKLTGYEEMSQWL